MYVNLDKVIREATEDDIYAEKWKIKEATYIKNQGKSNPSREKSVYKGSEVESRFLFNFSFHTWDIMCFLLAIHFLLPKIPLIFFRLTMCLVKNISSQPHL